MTRVDKISVTMDVYVEFEGRTLVQFSYAPLPDDAIVAALLAKNDALLLAAAQTEPATGMLG